MLSTITDARPDVVKRRSLIVLAIKDRWADKDIVAALGLSRAHGYREVKAVRDAIEQAERRRAS